MEKTDNLILSSEELAICMEESAVSVTSAYGHSPVVLMVDDATIGTLGNFSASIGKAKKQENVQCLSHCRIGIEGQYHSSLSVYIPRG